MVLKCCLYIFVATLFIQCPLFSSEWGNHGDRVKCERLVVRDRIECGNVSFSAPVHQIGLENYVKDFLDKNDIHSVFTKEAYSSIDVVKGQIFINWIASDFDHWINLTHWNFFARNLAKMHIFYLEDVMSVTMTLNPTTPSQSIFMVSYMEQTGSGNHLHFETKVKQQPLSDFCSIPYFAGEILLH